MKKVVKVIKGVRITNGIQKVKKPKNATKSKEPQPLKWVNTEKNDNY
ncbi:hypothetical protein [Capnocytophaga stomatis]|nr:hypothetical protein [Capnocytophaga stomatis]